MIQGLHSSTFLETVDNHDMGYVFEELIRIANIQSNEQAGEHFTPRDVIRMMSAILFTPWPQTVFVTVVSSVLSMTQRVEQVV